MRLLGYCLVCHRVRWIVADLRFDTRGNPLGTCSQCDDERKQK